MEEAKKKNAKSCSALYVFLLCHCICVLFSLCANLLCFGVVESGWDGDCCCKQYYGFEGEEIPVSTMVVSKTLEIRLNR